MSDSRLKRNEPYTPKSIYAYLSKSSRTIRASFRIALSVPLSSSGCSGTVMNETSLVNVTWLPLCLRTRNPKCFVSILINSRPETTGSFAILGRDQLSFFYLHLAML